ncbi:unnamed protein product [Rotaria sp. Silwood1]|nr:unnamed protein product [Rotaria sp. Silwood1]CAF3387930.1 unnamed protein product [Rotaria sp. Silwood1]CAF3412302.1 unnamed protein product [Rotaria sp. Silwood1]CAF3412743.1 unnamed protein product [Rotaria sp. Silwood1]CAF4647672.1 unnamed protein product [Rotaria sp. Silwood1]
MPYQRNLFWICIYSSCSLFFFSALIYDYYGPYSNDYGQLANENISIETALEQIPACTPDDRPRQRALLYTLQSWIYFAQKHKIQYWISYGTLVGYVQRRGLLPHDPDIDVLIMAQDTSQLFQLSQLNFSSIYKLKVHPQWYIVGEDKRSYFHSEGIHFVAPNARFINRKDGIHVDIWPMYDYDPSRTRMKKNSKPILSEYNKNYKWKSSPREWTFPLEECLFSGMKVWCPAQPEKLVANIYGPLSVKISSTACVNGLWVDSDDYQLAKSMMNKNVITKTTNNKEVY